MLPYEKLHAAMKKAGCQLTGSDLGLIPGFTATPFATPVSFGIDSPCLMWRAIVGSWKNLQERVAENPAPSEENLRRDRAPAIPGPGFTGEYLSI